MFTGIVEETGTVESIKRLANLCVLKVVAKKVLPDCHQGDSISVEGVCLTVTEIRHKCLVFDIMLETLAKTTLQSLKPGQKVNLERALRWGKRLGGHFVTGHVDNIGVVQDSVKKKNFIELKITYPKDLKRFLVPKGSVCINGISLTLGEVKEKYFSVYLIPYTLKVTTFGKLKKRDRVNIEVDLLARYLFS